jgi:hypothetical protein
MEDISRARTLVLATSDDLESAYAGATVLGRPWVDEVRVALPWLEEPERQAAARRLRRHHNDCGCRVGEVALAVAALTAWLAPVLLDVDRPGWPSVVLFLVVAAVGGKLLGLAVSRRLLMLDLRRLSAGARIKEMGGGGHGSNRVP